MDINTSQLPGQPVLGPNGEKIGTAENVYRDSQTDRPEWVAVKTEWFGRRSALVPLAEAQPDVDGIRVPYDKAKIKAAPHHDPDAELSETEEAELFGYYGIPYTGDTVTADNDRGDNGRGAAEQTGAVGHDVSGPTTDEAMTRSEERLRVGTETVAAGRARLRKYLVTEQVEQTVPVTHEEVRVQREPITEANRDAAYRGPELSDEEHEVVLHAERPVVAKETVPVERVRLDTETVTEQAQVNETVRKEEIDTDGVPADRSRD